MNPDHRVRRGAHRTSRVASATLLPSLLAILAVTSLITALYVWRGEDPTQSPAAASSPSRGAQVPQSSATPTATRASPPATSDETTEPASATSRGTTTNPKSSSGAQLRQSIAIVVLNQTGRSGLAATAAAQLRAKGWTVGTVGNFRGVVPETTVYYPPGAEAAALAAAKSLPTAPRIRPRFGNLSTHRLTVVVTSNYPS